MEGGPMKLRDVDLIIETGLAKTNSRAYQLINENKVPGVIHVGRTIKIVEDIYLSELRKRANAAVEADDETTDAD